MPCGHSPHSSQLSPQALLWLLTRSLLDVILHGAAEPAHGLTP